jgi:F-type H+-transporting ATPase subunit b
MRITMQVFALSAEPATGGQVAEIARTFGVDWPHLTAQVISFSIVCALLYWLAYKPVLAMLAERRKQIALGLANTEKINATLAQIETQRQAVLAAAREEAARLVAEARDGAKRLKDLETQRASMAAEQIVAQARAAAVQEHARMMKDLRGEIGRLVVQTTAAVTGKVLTPDDHHRLTQETARQLSA